MSLAQQQAVLESIDSAAALVKMRKDSRSKKRAPRFVPVKLYTKQSAITEDPHRFTCTEATSKAGKTMSHLEWFLAEGEKIGHGNGWWVATVSDTADIAFRRAWQRLDGFIDSCGKLKRVSDPLPYAKNETRKYIVFGGMTFWFKTAEKPDNLFGEDVQIAVGDEFTRWREAAWHALYTTLSATKGRCKLIGNLNGKRNWGYSIARKAEAGEPGWGYHKLTAADAVEGGVLEQETIEQAERDLPTAVYRELYWAEASEDGSNPFGSAAIAACVAPLSDLLPATWGWDLAKSTDWTVGIGLDDYGSACRFDRWNMHDLPEGIAPGLDYWEATEERIRELTGETQALVDSTGVGDPVLERIAKGRGNIDGFKFSSTSKQQLMEGLALAIQQRRVRFPDGPIRQELEDFTYEVTRTGVRYTAPPGLHDDCVCALALAVSRSSVQAPRFVPIGIGDQGATTKDEQQERINHALRAALSPSFAVGGTDDE